MSIITKLSVATQNELNKLSIGAQHELARLTQPLKTGWQVTIKTNASLFAIVGGAALVAGVILGRLL